MIAAPLAASAGVVAPIIGDRAFGAVGGTLDKLEAIPGFRTDLSLDEFRTQLNQLGLAFIAEPADMKPGDDRIRALQEATGTADSLPLMAASAMARKLSTGLDATVMDVKVGRGCAVKGPATGEVPPSAA